MRRVDVYPAAFRRFVANGWGPAKVALAFGLLYCATDYSLNKFAFGDGWSILWPLNGVTIALLVSRPRSRWMAMLIGVVVGTWISECQVGNSMRSETWQRVFSLIEVLLSAWLLPHFTSLEKWMREPHIYRRFVAAICLGPGVSGVLAAIYFHQIKGQGYALAFRNWGVADALGIAASLPLALALRSPEMRSLFRRRALPRTLGALLFGIVCSAFCLSVSRYPMLFLVYPLLLLVDLLLGFAGSAIAVCLVCFISVYLATHHLGPFGLWPASLALSRDSALQIFLSFHILALFPASIVGLERKRMTEDLRDANERLTMLASLDGLTGIANRRSFDERLVREWRSALRMQSCIALIMIDIDHFKEFNDCYGHQAGDQCLQSVAGVLADQVRRPEDLAARYGGEEFAVLLPRTGLSGATEVGELIRTAILEQAVRHDGCLAGCLTVSAGCAAMIPAHGEDPFQLLRAADEALYAAKKRGRNRVEAGQFTKQVAL